MHWVILSLLSAVSESIKDTAAKLSVHKTNEYVTAAALHLFTFLISAPLVVMEGIPPLNQSFWIGTLAFLLITPAWSILYTKSLMLSKISEVAPIMAFNPIFTALLTFVFKAQLPSVQTWFGIALISVGIYVKNIKQDTRNIFTPIFQIFSNRGSLYMLGVAFLWSIGAHFSKLKVDGSSAIFSTFTGGIVGILTGLILMKLNRIRIAPDELRSTLKYTLPVGIFYYLATFLSSLALVNGPAAIVFSLKRASIVGSTISGKIIFNERLTIFKLISLIIIFTGIAILSINN